MSEYRPNPEDLLKEIQRSDEKTNRGKLKVFFGMCPGVGKTFSMLRAAKEKRDSGIKVLVGIVETHQRPETEKILEGLEVLPRKQLQYKGAVIEEFDLDLALELKPDLILIDELAHTNAPGSKHPKRYQDVKDLLFAGIDVYTTLNVQHVESRADLVYQISGVPVREKVPDVFLELSNQIELIDLSPDDLLKRLKDGKVYLGDRADRAAENFFKEEKLTALRELALRFTAEVVDDQLRDQMQSKRIVGPWNTNERLMVAISQSPLSPRLIRSTRRIAYNLEAPWVALHVDTGFELKNSDHEMLVKNLNLARELGAEVITTKDRSVAEAMKRVAGERNVTQIIMGRPDRRLITDLFNRGNILDQLVNETSEVDIHVIRQRRRPVYRGFAFRLSKTTSRIGAYQKTVLYVGLLGLVGYPLQQYVGYRAIGFGLLLGILHIATLQSLGPTLMGAILSALIWDFFFIPPRFTLIVSEPEDVMMIFAYIAVASVAGFLATRIKRQENDLLQRERRSNILYEFGRNLAEASSLPELANQGAKSIQAVFLSDAVILGVDSTGKVINTPLNKVNLEVSEKDFAVAAWAFQNQKKAGWKTDTLSQSPCLCIPLRGRSNLVGVMVLYPKEDRSLSLDQENLIETISRHLATALERETLESVSRKAEVYEKSEKLHQALLNTVSHELRTPLTIIMGGATALKDSNGIEKAIINDIIESSVRLNQTIENLMDMSRISSGVLKLNENFFELNDFIRSVYQRTPAVLKDRIKLNLSDADLFVKGDEKILEHVFHNLVTNAAQYSPASSPIEIFSKKNQSQAEFLVKDEGEGIPEADLGKVFDRFYRSTGSPPGGVGLGLSISKAIVEAQGGTLSASNRTDRKGAILRVTLPFHEIPSGVLE